MEHSWGDCNAPHMYKFPGKSKSLVWILTKNCFTKYGQGLGCEYCGETSGCVGLNILHPAAECPLMQSALEAPFRHPKLLAPSPLWVLDLHFCHDNLTSHIKINVQRKFGLFVWRKKTSMKAINLQSLEDASQWCQSITILPYRTYYRDHRLEVGVIVEASMQHMRAQFHQSPTYFAISIAEPFLPYWTLTCHAMQPL